MRIQLSAQHQSDKSVNLERSVTASQIFVCRVRFYEGKRAICKIIDTKQIISEYINLKQGKLSVTHHFVFQNVL